MPQRIAEEFARLINFVFPEDCSVCGTALDNVSRIPVCANCLAAPQPLAAEFACSGCQTPYLSDYPLRPDGRCALCRSGAIAYQAAFSFGSYDGELRTLIHVFKYGGVRPLAGPLGELLLRALPPGREFDAIVPLPLHWWKRLMRGFNQADLLARELSRRMGIPRIAAVRRAKRTAVQAGLTHAMRRKNVAGAFAVSNPAAVAGKRILLVDDVLTTGATAASCAQALRRAGAASVCVVTLARVDRRQPELVSRQYRAAELGRAAITGA